MSTLMVQATEISNVRPHPNADRLDVAEVLGWQVVVQKGSYKGGEDVIYFPPDTVLPMQFCEEHGIAPYVQSVKNETGQVYGGRLRAAKLRGEPSYGFVLPYPDLHETESEDRDTVECEGGNYWAERYGATKYVPPMRPNSGDAERDHPAFPRYTEIENLRNLPDVLQEGEEVVVTEKIHGTNCRVGLVEGELMCGSHSLRRKLPRLEDGALDEEAARTHLYAYPLTLPQVRSFLSASNARSVVLYGEVYGRVQSLKYGLPNGLGFRAFDLMLDGRYVDKEQFLRLMGTHGIEVAPVLYRGPYSLEQVRGLAEGRSTMPGADHIREGVVVTPLRERTDPAVGRVILKYVSDSYLTGKHSDEEVADI
jgi:RNA ligase (TIGR02306 family)